MATASRVQISSTHQPTFYRDGITQEQSSKVSDLLQTNHDNYHMYFNESGFHNHIVHHLLTIWSLGASAKNLSDGFDTNKSYQRPLVKHKGEAAVDLNDDKAFNAALGERDRYRDFLLYFQSEIEKSSWQEVVQKYIFAGDERANDLRIRLFGGLIHPFIHLGFGVEFAQPAIVAEGLAEVATHARNLGDVLIPTEKAANENTAQPSKSIVQLLDDISQDKQLKKVPRWGGMYIPGILEGGKDRLVHHLSQYRVDPKDLQEQTAAMINAVCYYTAAAQRPGHRIIFDFFYIHGTNSSIFVPAFLKQDWLSEAEKVRLLEWKARYDLILYSALGCPTLNWDEVKKYKPLHPGTGWDDIFKRACNLMDDGHTSKFIRTLAYGQKASVPYEHKDEFRIKHDDWLQIAHMAMDSSENTFGDEEEGRRWGRGAGFDEMWEDIPARAQL